MFETAKGRGWVFIVYDLANENVIQEKLEEQRIKKSSRAKKKLKTVIRGFSKPPMSARAPIQNEPIIRIYPDYNPKLSRNQMRPVTIKAWETARTLASTPFSTQKRRRGDIQEADGFSRTTEHPFASVNKPKTAAHGVNRRTLTKSKTTANLYPQKPHTSHMSQRPRLFSRESKSRNSVRQLQSIFSSNCMKSSSSIIDPQTARKYESEILALRQEIADTQQARRKFTANLNSCKSIYVR